jgi:hypothetical protein
MYRHVILSCPALETVREFQSPWGKAMLCRRATEDPQEAVRKSYLPASDGLWHHKRSQSQAGVHWMAQVIKTIK